MGFKPEMDNFTWIRLFLDNLKLNKEQYRGEFLKMDDFTWTKWTTSVEWTSVGLRESDISNK